MTSRIPPVEQEIIKEMIRGLNLTPDQADVFRSVTEILFNAGRLQALSEFIEGIQGRHN